MAHISRMVIQVAVFLVIVVITTEAQQQQQQPASSSSSFISNIPATATKFMASSADGISRYLAPDGPIQPALTAIGGLPMRGIEMTNNGISRISSSFNNGAQSLSHRAGDEGRIRMPGLDTLESSMPASFASLGNMMHGAIQQKNKFIMNQAERGIQASQRLQQMMQNGLQSKQARSSSGGSSPMVMMGSMMSDAQDTMMKGTEQIKSQLKQSLQSSLGRMKKVQGVGDNMRNQAEGIKKTLSEGVQGTMEHLQKTGMKVQQQLHGGMEKNMGAMSDIMGSMHGSMGNMQQNMHKNLDGVMRQAQNAAQQVHSQLQEVAMKPMELVQSLTEGLGKMMQGGGSGMHHSSSSSRGKY